MASPKYLTVGCSLVTAGLLLWLAVGCDHATPDNGKLKVVATTSIIGDWVKIVGGDYVDLKTLVGCDGDPHEYEPVPADSIALANASVVFANGLGLENWLDKLMASARSKAVRIALTDSIQIRRVPTGEQTSSTESGDGDPHAWQNIQNAAIMVAHIRDALAKADPSHADQFRANCAAYTAQLNNLDAWAIQQIHSIPPDRRKLVTSHDAFGYFGQRYGIDISGGTLKSVTTEASDPSAQQIAQVVEEIKSSHAPVIFLENIENPRLIQTIASAAHVQVGPPLYTDALGQPGSAGDTYLKMIRYNVDTLVKALNR